MTIWGLRVLRGEGLDHLMGVADRVWWFSSVIMIRLLPPTFFSSISLANVVSLVIFNPLVFWVDFFVLPISRGIDCLHGCLEILCANLRWNVG